MSELNLRATELSGVLHGILKCLGRYDHELGRKYFELLQPLVNEYDEAIFITSSVLEAKEALVTIKNLMHNVNGAATKGGHEFFPKESDLLNHYWALETIFRESRYSKMNLVYNWQGYHRGRC
jgi:hypothetical protein